jgi:CHAT domain-containing protein
MRLDAGSRQLYQILIQPFDKQLSSFRKLIIVPDHALAYLPFEALAGSRRAKARKGQYLVERFAIGYAPSASALAAVRSSNAGSESRSFIAFADPAYRVEIGAQERSPGPEAKTWELSDYLERGFDLRRLPYTRTEATNIAALFPAGERKVFLGTDANEQQVKSEPLARYRYLHFAAHGIVDEENPARSGVILSLGGNQKDDGILQMSEIMRLKLNADLVTLSACRTGMGKVVGGEGVLGLTRAFLYAGTRSVVASLWNVNDTATAELMTTFYQNLRRGLAKDEALRQAKLRLLHGRPPTWRHPFYWAPFVLVGANN